MGCFRHLECPSQGGKEPTDLVAALVKDWMPSTLTFAGRGLPGTSVGGVSHSKSPTASRRDDQSHGTESDGRILTRMSLLSSPTLPKRYVLPSLRSSSNAIAETKDECP